MKLALLPYLACPACEGAIEAPGIEAPGPVRSGQIRCAGCARAYAIREGVPVLLARPDAAPDPTAALYGDLWQGFAGYAGPDRPDKGYQGAARSHIDLLRAAAGRSLVEGEAGIDAGCGDGGSLLKLARAHPEVQFVGVDLSEGPMTRSAEADLLANAHLVQGDLLAIPLARDRFDFAYSFGVLHHTPAPEAAFTRLLERLRPGAPVTVFLYKDFSDLAVKRLLLVPVSLLRRLTSRLPPALLRVLGWIGAPAVFLLLTLPARALRALGAGRFARHIPYGTFPSLAAIASSLQDRFGAPHEHRFSIRDLEGWAARARLEEARVVDCLEHGFSGLVLSGRKPRAAGAATSASGRPA